MHLNKQCSNICIGAKVFPSLCGQSCKNQVDDSIKCPIHHNRQSHSALSVNRILPYLSLLFISCVPCQLYFSSNSSAKGSIALQAVEWDSWHQLFHSAGCHRDFSVGAFGQTLLVLWFIWHLAGPPVVLFGRNSTASSLSNNKTEGTCPDHPSS